MEETVRATSDSVVCTLSEGELRDRREELRSGVIASITAVRETADGFELAFPSGSVDMVRDFVASERQCCGFMTFTIDDRDGHTWLGLSGPEGTKEFVRRWIPEGTRDGERGSGRWFKASGSSLLGALVTMVVCETPLLAAMLLGVGAGSAVGRVSGWLDAGALALACSSIGFAGVALYRRRATITHRKTDDGVSCGAC